MNASTTLQNQWREMVAWLKRCPPDAPCPFGWPDAAGVAVNRGLGPIDPSPRSADTAPLPGVEPLLKNLTADILLTLLSELAAQPRDQRLDLWCEKLLRGCELHRTELKPLLCSRGQSPAQGRRMGLGLCLLFLKHFSIHEDARYVNIALKMLEQKWLAAGLMNDPWPPAPSDAGWLRVMLVLIHGLLEQAIGTIDRPDWRTAPQFSSAHLVAPAPELPMTPQFAADNAPGVVVFSPNPYSLYTLCVLELLTTHGVRVQGIALRRLLNRKRFLQEFRRDGSRLLGKIWRKAVLRRRAYAPTEYETLPEYLTRIGGRHQSVPAWAAAHAVPVWRCQALNDPIVLDALQQHQPRAVVFTGGGLIRQPVLDAAGAGVINTHMGLLPPYRGMDVVEWPILEGHPDQTGLTVHFMVKGLDEGSILAMHHAPRAHTRDIVQLRQRMEVLSPQASAAATIRLLHGQCRAQPQTLVDGRQYFIIHPRLYEMALAKYQRFRATESE